MPRPDQVILRVIDGLRPDLAHLLGLSRPREWEGQMIEEALAL